MLRIQKVSIGSAFRIGAVMSVIWWIILLVLSLLFAAAFGDFSADYYGGYSSSQSIDFSGGMMSLVCGVPIMAIVGGIAWALGALIYNLAAGWVGGLEIEVEQRPGTWQQVTVAKSKREDWGPSNPQNKDPYP